MSPSQPVIEGAARFLHLNHLLVTYLLRLRFQTLRGLALTEGVVSLMSLVASAPTQGASKHPRHTVDSAPSNNLRSGAVWSMLGTLGDTFISDTCALLKLLGGEPMPAPPSSRFGRTAGKDAGCGWWASFPPSTPQEELLNQQQAGGGEGEELDRGNGGNGIITPLNWTLFDQKKLMFSLRVTSLASAFLRRKSGTTENSSFSFEGPGEGGLLAMDFNAITLAFVACAGLCNRKGATSSSSVQWLMSPSSTDAPSALVPLGYDHGDRQGPGPGVQGVNSALPALQYIIENLICVLHNMNAAASTAEKACWALDLDRCVRIAEQDFPSHSFIKQVGRWIRDQMNHEVL